MSEEKIHFKSGFVAIIGRPNVGKSTLLNRILGQKVAITSNKPQTTRNRILGIHNLPDGQILFLDTPGIHKAKGPFNKYMVDQALSSCSEVDAILLLVEANDRPGGGDEYVLKLIERSKAPILLVINKCDLVPRPELLPLIQSWAERFSFQGIIPVSATKGEGVDDLVETIGELLPEGPQYYSGDMITDQPERFIVAEMIREQVFRRTRQEVPYGVGVQVENFEEKPEKDLVVINAVIQVEREAHKSIILGKRGAMIRTVGQAARKEIEKMLGTRVFLEIFVRVEPNWTSSARGLREMGYE